MTSRTSGAEITIVPGQQATSARSEPDRGSDDVAMVYRRHLSRGRALFAQAAGNLSEESAQGVWVRCSDGRELLDAGGYGVFLHGHRDPHVVGAVRRQLDRRPMSTRLLLDPVCAQATQTLVSVAPSGLDHVHWCNSGAEATELALKLARANGFRRVIAATGGFHGKTLGALSVTGRERYRSPFLPLLQVTHVPYGDLGQLVRQLEEAPAPTCVILEPVLGEAGVILPPPGYLSGVAQACRRTGALLILDEIQTGLGRTGRWWGGDHDGVVADVVLVGKILSGGVMPVAAVLATAAAYSPFDRDPFLHTSTYAGSPLACAAAQAGIESIVANNLVERAERIGARLLEAVRALCEEVFADAVVEVRGAGLMIGIEFGRDGLVGELVITLLEEGLLVSTALNSDRVLRLTPAAVMTVNEEQELLNRLRRAGQRVMAGQMF